MLTVGTRGFQELDYRSVALRMYLLDCCWAHGNGFSSGLPNKRSDILSLVESSRYTHVNSSLNRTTRKAYHNQTNINSRPEVPVFFHLGSNPMVPASAHIHHPTLHYSQPNPTCPRNSHRFNADDPPHGVHFHSVTTLLDNFRLQWDRTLDMSPR